MHFLYERSHQESILVSPDNCIVPQGRPFIISSRQPSQQLNHVLRQAARNVELEKTLLATRQELKAAQQASAAQPGSTDSEGVEKKLKEMADKAEKARFRISCSYQNKHTYHHTHYNTCD